MGMLQVYDGGRTCTPADALPELRDLYSRDPLAVNDGPEALAARTRAPAWAVELALEALALEDGEQSA